MTVAAVVLAAGGGTRWTGSGHKLLAPFRGRPLVAWAIEAAQQAELDELIVVTGAVDLVDLLPSEATVLANPLWETGQASSLQVAAAYAKTKGHQAMILGLGDTPLVPTSAWQDVAQEPGDLVCANFGGERRPPFKVAAKHWAAFPRQGDQGAIDLLLGRVAPVTQVSCAGNPIDIDTVEDLAQWN